MSYPALDQAREALDEALAGLPLTDQEARTMAWLKRWEPETINAVASVIWLARMASSTPWLDAQAEEPSTEEP